MPGGVRAPANGIGLRLGSAVPWLLFNGPQRQAMLDVFARDFNQATIQNSLIEVWDRPGLGVDLNPDKAARYLREEDKDFFD